MVILYIALGVFGAAAIGGLTLVTLLFQNKRRPRPLIFFHGLFAVVGLTLLIIHCIRNRPNPLESVYLFCIAATIGFVLAFQDLFGRKVPVWLAAVHGVVALAGFVYLVFAVLDWL